MKEEIEQPIWLKTISDDLWLKIFQHMTCDELQTIIPLVCTEWCRIAEDPYLWRIVQLDLTDRGSLLQLPARRFFEKRKGCLRKLALHLNPSDPHLGSEILAGLSGSCQLTELALGYKPTNLGKNSSLHYLHRAGQECPNLLHRLSGLTMLHKLHLHSHLILADERCTSSFKQLGHLRELVVTFPDSGDTHLLKGLPSTISYLTALQSLAVHHAGPYACRSLPDWIGGLTCLTAISFVGCGARRWPAGMTRLSSLAYLRVVDAKAGHTYFPANLSNLKALVHVDLACRHVPPEISTLTHLTALCIRGCKTTPRNTQVLEQVLEQCKPEKLSLEAFFGCLPYGMTQHEGLRELTMCDPILQHLPDGPYLRSLETLDLSGCTLLLQVPEYVLRAPQLRSLTIFDEEDPVFLRSRSGDAHLYLTEDPDTVRTVNEVNALLSKRSG